VIDEDALERAAIRAGSRARVELEQTEAAFNRLREAAMAELIATGPDQTAKRDRLIASLQIWSAVQEALVYVVNDGDPANIALAKAGLNRR
jgi:hypothetical protein